MGPDNIPADISGLDFLFMESTQGDRRSQPRDLVVYYMNEKVKNVLRRGGMSLAIALGGDRAIDIALDQALCGIKPCLDGGLPGNAWEIYQSPEGYWCPNDIPIEPEVAQRITPLFRMEDVRDRMLTSGNAYSIVASSGSLQGGQSVKWAETILPDPNSLILQCNFQFEGTPGADLEKMGRGGTLQLSGKSIKVNCDVVRVEASAHAGANELLEIAQWFGARNTALYHGNWHARSVFRERLARHRIFASTPLNGDVIEI
jgi:Cft2 family RNA processing exonuclease